MVRLSTLDRSSMRDVPLPRVCHYCNLVDESHDHLFFSCSFIRPLWIHLQDTCKFRSPASSWSGFVNWASHQWARRNLRMAVNKLMLSTTINKIWMERNNRAFKNRRCSQMELLRRITDLIRQKLLTLQVRDSVDARRLILEWNLPVSFIRPPLEPPDCFN
ncbi:uncharacterized protein LOC132304837 [Cornus florida]|uniref:uncharacterized protein LOC132304837 n=1 Tax=Cornus florida TaxID=4283 RepID=UPI0028971419|nr:uncharacterized protein LOC132304837 [Cornus florida]